MTETLIRQNESHAVMEKSTSIVGEVETRQADAAQENKNQDAREKSVSVTETEAKQDRLEIANDSSSNLDHSPVLEEKDGFQNGNDEDSGHEVYTAAIETWRLFTITGALCLGVIISLMDLSIISTALLTISEDFGSYRLTIWAALAYILTDIGCAVFFARLADVFGRKQTILTSYFFFTCFSLAGGFAQTVEQLIIFRTLQGVGGTGLYSLTMVILPEIAPPKFLPIMVSLLGISVATAGVMGPVIGGVIAGSTTWRWIFWLNVPIGTISIALLFFIWPSAANITNIADAPKFKQMDFLGAFLSATASISFVFCLQSTGTKEYSWNSPLIVALITISAVSAVSFYSWEYYISRAKISAWILPQLPFRIVLHRPMALAILSTVLVGYVQFTSVFSIPLRNQVVDLNTPVKAGLRLLPLVASTAVGSMVGGAASAKKNLTYYTMIIGTALVVLGTGLMSSLPTNGNQTNSQYGYEVLLGLGMGMSISTATFMNSLEVEFIDHAVAQGTVAQSRILGGAIGIAVSTINLNNYLKAGLKNIVSPEVLQLLYISPFTITNYGVTAELAFRESYVKAFRQDMRVCMYLACVAFVCAIGAWQKNAPTVQERSEKLAMAVKVYENARSQGVGVDFARQRMDQSTKPVNIDALC